MLLDEIIESPETNFRVHGPAGTGKSTLLVNRAVEHAYRRRRPLDQILDLNMTVAAKDQKRRVFEGHRSRLQAFGEFRCFTFHKFAAIIANDSRQDSCCDRIFSAAIERLRNDPLALENAQFLKQTLFIQIDTCEDATEPMRCLLVEFLGFKYKALGQQCFLLLAGDPMQKTTWCKSTNRLLTGDIFDSSTEPLPFATRVLMTNYRARSHLQIQFLNALVLAIDAADTCTEQAPNMNEWRNCERPLLQSLAPTPGQVNTEYGMDMAELGIHPIRSFVVDTEEVDPFVIHDKYIPIIMEYVKLLRNLPADDPQRYVLVMTKYKGEQYGGLLNALTNELKKRAVHTAMICNSQSGAGTDGVSQKDLFLQAMARRAEVVFSTIETSKGLSPAFAGILDFDHNLGSGSELLPTRREWHDSIKGAIFTAMSRPRYGLFVVARQFLHPLLSAEYGLPYRHADGPSAPCSQRVCREPLEGTLYPRKMAVTTLVQNMDHFSTQEILNKHVYFVNHLQEPVAKCLVNPLTPPHFDRPEFDSVAGSVAEYVAQYYLSDGASLTDPAPVCNTLSGTELDYPGESKQIRVWGCIAAAFGSLLNCVIHKAELITIMEKIPDHKKWWFRQEDYADPVLVLPGYYRFSDMGMYEPEVLLLCHRYNVMMEEVLAGRTRVFGWAHMFQVVERILIATAIEKNSFHLLGNVTDIHKLTAYFANMEVQEGVRVRCQKIKEALRALRNRNDLQWQAQVPVRTGMAARHSPNVELDGKIDLINFPVSGEVYSVLGEVKFTSTDWTVSHQLQMLLYGGSRWVREDGPCRSDFSLYYNVRTGSVRLGWFVVENPQEVRRIVEEEMGKGA